MDRETRARWKWGQLYTELRNYSLVSRRCGISRLSLRKWVNRYRQYGVDGLKNYSRRPHQFPRQRVFELEVAWILDLRMKRNLGARRIKAELLRLPECRISIETIHKVLIRNGVLYWIFPLPTFMVSS
jgi:transposase